MKANLYLPITSQPRELDSKLLLALFARERGHNPVLGYKSAFHSALGKLPPGYFLAHNARAVRNTDSTLKLRKFGHRVLVLDEEALVRQSDEIFLKKHLQDAFTYVNTVLTWGEDDLNLWKRSDFDLDGRLFVTGNPRVDTMRREALPFHQPLVDAIRQAHGDYVLLNTNFPTVNNLTPQGGGVRLASWALDSRGQEVEQAFLGNKRAMYEKMLEIAPKLAKAIAPLNLIIRPHPNEDHEPWHAAARGIANAKVVFEGGVVPWIIGAKALVHNNCTTAVESAVLRTPVLNFRPWASDYDNELSMAFGRDCADADELARAIADIVGKKAGVLDAGQQRRLERHIASVSGSFSCERILDVIAAAGVPSATDPLRAGSVERARVQLESTIRWLDNYWRLYAKRSGRRKLRHLRENYPDLKIGKLDSGQLAFSPQQFDLFMRQFPPMQTGDLQERIDRYSKAFSRFKGMRPVVTGENLVTIA
ncbi:MAG TPA: surface carbohydrate biosynthesis protein [Rhizobiaceae bacterium]|nr:surface carbohydrate biosynthesis protein [Rhizobiaceae bacterium]